MSNDAGGSKKNRPTDANHVHPAERAEQKRRSNNQKKEHRQ